MRCEIDTKWYELLCKGEKKVEGRLKKGKWAGLKSGDTLIISPSSINDCELEFLVKDIREYTSLEDMLIQEGIRNVLPGVPSLEQAIGEYEKFYSPEMIEEHNIIAIELEAKPATVRQLNFVTAAMAYYF